MKQILPGLYTITGLPAGRVYVAEDSGGLTLIDATVSGMAGRILSQIKTLGRQPRDVRTILITHAHPDHVGSLAELKAQTGAQVVASAVERPVIEGKIPIPRVPPEKLSGPIKFRPPMTTLKAVGVDRALAGGEMLEAMGGLQAVFTPGHAPGHLSFWQPEKRVLFCGDVIFNLFGMGLPFAFLTVDMDENKRSIRKLVELNPSVIGFGHGEPVTENAAQRLREFAHKVGVM